MSSIQLILRFKALQINIVQLPLKDPLHHWMLCHAQHELCSLNHLVIEFKPIY